MICLNRIHRIPIVQFEEYCPNSEAKKQQGTLLYVLSLKTVFTETIVKLSDPKPSLCSHIKQKTISERRVGTWSRLYTVPQTATCEDAITLFLEKRISSVPVVDSYGRMLGVIKIPIMDIIASLTPSVYGTSTMTIYDCIAIMVHTDRQSLVIIDVERRPQGIISYSDIMDYIQNSSDSHHKLSLA
ncbi:CBS domain-containing protein [Trichostrongylus colubriformis]|uniref:CBS domain-containing protein n=1 Tax=Trichostrongylus colubriformis TaxID=6319 RepID=A0AAN8IJC4_TRICO